MATNFFGIGCHFKIFRSQVASGKKVNFMPGCGSIFLVKKTVNTQTNKQKLTKKHVLKGKIHHLLQEVFFSVVPVNIQSLHMEGHQKFLGGEGGELVVLKSQNFRNKV